MWTKAQASAASRRWRQKHSEKAKEVSRRSREKHLDKVLYREAKYRAKHDGLSFTIKHGDVKIPKKCPVLGIPLKMELGKRSYNSPSLDRIDNSKGYVKGNVWVISWRANRLKCDASLQELIALVKAIQKVTRRKR